MLASLIEEGDRESLVFIIQVILEGWGLTHYRSLAQGCQSEDFTEVLKALFEMKPVTMGVESFCAVTEVYRTRATAM